MRALGGITIVSIGLLLLAYALRRYELVLDPTWVWFAIVALIVASGWRLLTKPGQVPAGQTPPEPWISSKIALRVLIFAVSLGLAYAAVGYIQSVFPNITRSAGRDVRAFDMLVALERGSGNYDKAMVASMCLEVTEETKERKFAAHQKELQAAKDNYLNGYTTLDQFKAEMTKRGAVVEAEIKKFNQMCDPHKREKSSDSFLSGTALEQFTPSNAARMYNSRNWVDKLLAVFFLLVVSFAVIGLVSWIPLPKPLSYVAILLAVFLLMTYLIAPALRGTLVTVSAAPHPEDFRTHDDPPVVAPCSGQLDTRVLAENHWYDTGCYVQPMQTLVFTVTSHNVKLAGEQYCGIRGCEVNAEVAGRLLCPDFPYMALVGRVNGGTCFLMPTRVTNISANNPGIGPGKLEVSFNNEIITRVGGFPEDHAWRKIEGAMGYTGH